MSSCKCGLDCSTCEIKESCKTCQKTNCHPFGGNCVIDECCQKNEISSCSDCKLQCSLRNEILKEINNIGINLNELNAVRGIYMNVECKLTYNNIKILNDDDIYLGNQILSQDGNHFFGIAANMHFILICKYNLDYSNPEVIYYHLRQKKEA